jgi:hypothetical protein
MQQLHLGNRQRGLGLWGWIIVLGAIGFVTLIALKLIPFYLNEMAVARVVRSTAQDPGNSGLPLPELRKAMQTRWDVEGITALSTRDVKIVKYGAGRALSYEYEQKADLFYNISIVVKFENQFPMKGGGSVE